MATKSKAMGQTAFRIPNDLKKDVAAQAKRHRMNESTFMRWCVAHTTRQVREGKLVPPVMRPDIEAEAA